MRRGRKTNHEHKSQIHFNPARLLLVALFRSSAERRPSRDLTGDLDTGVTMLVTATATVDSIDLGKRELTLKGEGGHPVTLTVDQRVKRLNEISLATL